MTSKEGRFAAVHSPSTLISWGDDQVKALLKAGEEHVYAKGHKQAGQMDAKAVTAALQDHTAFEGYHLYVLLLVCFG